MDVSLFEMSEELATAVAEAENITREKNQLENKLNVFSQEREWRRTQASDGQSYKEPRKPESQRSNARGRRTVGTSKVRESSQDENAELLQEAKRRVQNEILSRIKSSTKESL